MDSEITNVRRKRANDARLKAIAEKSRKIETQQLQIKNALHSLDDSVKKSTHIQFSDSDDDSNNGHIDTEESKLVAERKSADDILGLAGDNNDDEEINFNLKPQFAGKQGEKLLELQSRYGNDARFQLDARFANEEIGDSSSSDESSSEATNNQGNTELKDEIQRNMQLLNQVVGHDVTSKEQAKKKKGEKFIDISSRTYNPTKDEHLELKEKKLGKESPTKKRKIKIDTNKAEVDGKRFFQTSTSELRNAFGTKSGDSKVDSLPKSSQPFSFLAMMGRPTQEREIAPSSECKSLHHEETSEEFRFAFSSAMKKDIPTLQNSIGYDSSETEDESEDDGLDEEKTGSAMVESTTESTAKIFAPKEGLSTFFLSSPKDRRIFEGVKEFCWGKRFEQIQKEWLQVKDTLIKDYKKKHRDAKRRQRKANLEAKHHDGMKGV